MNASSSDLKIGAVVIGRNEGERLKRCLRSLNGQVAGLVYVDSGSNDGSVEFAVTLGVAVVVLDTQIPFTAARARNAGFERLMQTWPDMGFVQFVDGDCEVDAAWLEIASGVMVRQDVLAVVFGRRRERHPQVSIYNTLCDIEWDTPLGESASCGGDALMRVSAFKAVRGYDPSLIAGEEPEMCVRMRRAGWKMQRIDAEMTLHDANMTRFSQWWKRTLRAGHAYAEGASLHGASPERHWVKEVRSNWLWGLSAPAMLLAVLLQPISAILLLIYPVQMLRIYRNADARRTAYERKLFAVFCVLAKLPLMLGQMRFVWNAWAGKRSGLIEYK